MLQAAATAAPGQGIDFYLRHPQAIKEAIANPKTRISLGENLAYEIATAAAGAELFHQQYGPPAAPPPSEVPVAANAAARESQIAELNARKISGKTTAAEDQKLLRLYEQRLASEQPGASAELSSHRKALGIPDDKPPAGEFAKLIEKSISRSGGRGRTD